MPTPRHPSSRFLLLSLLWLAGCAGLPASPALESDDSAHAFAYQPSSPTQFPAAFLTPEHWIAQSAAPQSLLLDRAAIAAQNSRLLAQDASVLDLASLPDALSGADVRARIEALSAAPRRNLFDASGRQLTAADIEALRASLALSHIAESVPLRFGLVTRRADLRTFPTARRVFSRPDDTDIDRFQESALFPGMAVAVLHESADGGWWFVASQQYSAWVEASQVALGSRAEVLEYTTRTPFLVVTGAQVRSVFTPEAPALSGLVLDMGVRLPLQANWPMTQPVNGQLAHGSHVVTLPLRKADGRLDWAQALVPRSADVQADYLPLSRANLLHQAFKFLGERYGWGHAYGARDCSGFVAEVYRSFGVEMPRNSRDQGMSTAFDRIAFSPEDDHAARLAVLRTLDVGDLVYIPGHVMMVIGQAHGDIWLIHDTAGIHFRDARGQQVSLPLNQVAVTPLLPLLDDAGRPFTDLIYSIQRFRNP